MNYRFDGDRILLTFDRGDLINKTFEDFAHSNDISYAWLNGIGALQDPEIGYYSLESRSYHKKIFNGDYELTSLIGNISIKENECFSHTHITFSDKNYNVFGGHLFDAKITAAGEFIMVPGDKGVIRKMNSDIGLSLWCLGEKFA